MVSYPSYCGLVCDECGYRETDACQGCVVHKGQMFWGQCSLAACAVKKEVNHCGQCSDYPCADYTRYASDPEHGGNREKLISQWLEAADKDK